MNILLYFRGEPVDAWLAAIARQLPNARVQVWPESDDIPADYAFVQGPPPELYPTLARVKAIFNLGAGVNAFLRMPALPPAIPVIRLEDAGMAVQMREYVTYAVLGWYREFATYREQQRTGRWEERARRDKRDFGVGILGLGTLGSAVATTLRDFGFSVAGWSRTRKAVPGVRSFAGGGERDAFVATCRVLVAMLPLTPATRGLINRDLLGLLPPGAYLINVGRGGLLVDDDLLALLDNGHLSGAMLDVFHREPLPTDHPFWHHPGITITPHIAAATLADESVAQIAEKIRRLEAGLPVSGIVDRELAY